MFFFPTLFEPPQSLVTLVVILTCTMGINISHPQMVVFQGWSMLISLWARPKKQRISSIPNGGDWTLEFRCFLETLLANIKDNSKRIRIHNFFSYIFKFCRHGWKCKNTPRDKFRIVLEIFALPSIAFLMHGPWPMSDVRYHPKAIIWEPLLTQACEVGKVGEGCEGCEGCEGW